MDVLPSQTERRVLRLSPAQLIALPLAGGLIWLLARQLSGVDPSEVLLVLRAHGPASWILAIAATFASFLALGQYDALFHRRLRTGVPPPRAAFAGMRAIAVGQAAGLGLLTAGLSRWRLLPELPGVTVAKLTALVGLGFVASLVVLLFGATLVAGQALPHYLSVPWVPALLCILLPGLAYALSRGGIRLGDAGVLLSWAALDTIFAAVTLWLFLPEGTPFMTVYVAYLAALGAGLLSNAPGGLGAFELALIALLPHVPLADLISAVLAHRIVYYALPALAALPWLLSPRPARLAPLIPVRWDDIALAPTPDWDLTSQGARVLARPDLSGAWLVRPAPLCLVAIGPAHGDGDPDQLGDLAASAAILGRIPVHYRIDAKAALSARRAGFAVQRIAQEAILRPDNWNLSGPNHRQLRRKLRHAEKSGVQIVPAGFRLPLGGMADVNRAWRAAHGHEKGFSMGVFSAALLDRQRVWLAWQENALVGFVSFSISEGQWCLDLMRYRPEAPTGTMHALVSAAISTAAKEGVARLSLASVPDFAPPLGRLGKGGLCQFKAAFGPEWVPRYAAAPDRPRLWAGLAAIGWAVRHPHNYHEDFAFELRSRPCESRDISDAFLTTGAPDVRRPLPSTRNP